MRRSEILRCGLLNFVPDIQIAVIGGGLGTLSQLSDDCLSDAFMLPREVNVHLDVTEAKLLQCLENLFEALVLGLEVQKGLVIGHASVPFLFRLRLALKRHSHVSREEWGHVASTLP